MNKLLIILIASTFSVGCASSTRVAEPNPDLIMYFQPLSAEDKSAISTAKHIQAMQNAKPCTDAYDTGNGRSRCH